MGAISDESADAACPSQALLRSFRAGQLGGVVVEHVRRHLTDCRRCAEYIEAAKLDLTVSGPGRSATPSAPPLPESAAIGCPGRLGQYELLETLGAGGMGQVYKARHVLMKRTVALKVMRPGLLEQPDAIQRFRREIEALARLNHSNLVAAQYADCDGPVHFLVMDLVEGRTLAQQVRDHGPLPVAEACDCIRQAAEALAHAHAQGLVHRDLKPSNLLRTPAGQVKMLDLGLVRLHAEPADAADLTASRQVLGTPDYMAPEQWDNAHAVDIRADLYSLGCTLYFLLSGTPPFGGPDYASAARKMKGHLADMPPPLTGVPAPVTAVVERLLRKDPAERFQTPAELVAALMPAAHARQPPRRHRLPWLVALTVLLTPPTCWFALHVLRPPEAVTPAPLRVVALTVRHYRGEPAQEQGELGVSSVATRFDDDLRVEARLSAPAHCYLLAFNPDGKGQLCYPRDEQTPPPLVTAFTYPENPNRYFAATDGVGLQAFVLVASRAPLPPFAQWRAEHPPAPWRAVMAGGVWREHDGAFTSLPRDRGQERWRDGVPAVLHELAAFFQVQPGVETFEILAFPIKAKEAAP